MDTNIFQGNNGIKEITEDFKKYYFEAYFYLSRRFGPAQEHDDCSIWKFEFKQYKIVAELNSIELSFMIFGDEKIFKDYSARSPYRVRYWREQKRNEDWYLNLYSEEKTDRENAIIQNLWAKFNNENGSDFEQYLEKYNDEVLGVEKFKHYSNFNYSNTKTKHALKTLKKFLNNMMYPVMVRDCYFNIKGRTGWANINENKEIICYHTKAISRQ